MSKTFSLKRYQLNRCHRACMEEDASHDQLVLATDALRKKASTWVKHFSSDHSQASSFFMKKQSANYVCF